MCGHVPQTSAESSMADCRDVYPWVTLVNPGYAGSNNSTNTGCNSHTRRRHRTCSHGGSSPTAASKGWRSGVPKKKKKCGVGWAIVRKSQYVSVPEELRSMYSIVHVEGGVCFSLEYFSLKNVN